jgi:hypothetical protein
MPTRPVPASPLTLAGVSRRTGDPGHRRAACPGHARDPRGRPHEPRISSEAADTVVRVDLGPSEWTMKVGSPRQQVLRAAPANLTGPYIPPQPGRFAIALVSGSLGRGLGRAVLHYQRGDTRIYCRDEHMGILAACILPAHTEKAIGYAADPDTRITVTPISYPQFPEDLHPAYTRILRARDVRLHVCSDLISADLAEDLGLLLTAHARRLYQLGRCGPGARILPTVPAARQATPSQRPASAVPGRQTADEPLFVTWSAARRGAPI